MKEKGLSLTDSNPLMTAPFFDNPIYEENSNSQPDNFIIH